MSLVSRTLSLVTAGLLLAGSAQAAGPLQAEFLHLELPLLAATSPKAKAAPAGAAAPAATTPAAAVLAPQTPTAAPAGRSRAEVLAELRAARAAGELNHAEAEIGWPVNGRKAR